MSKHNKNNKEQATCETDSEQTGDGSVSVLNANHFKFVRVFQISPPSSVQTCVP